jgi:hypothetical protein
MTEKQMFETIPNGLSASRPPDAIADIKYCPLERLGIVYLSCRRHQFVNERIEAAHALLFYHRLDRKIDAVLKRETSGTAKVTRLRLAHFEIDKEHIGFAALAPFAHPLNLPTAINKHTGLTRPGTGTGAFLPDRLEAHLAALVKPAEENEVEILGRLEIPISKAADDLVRKRLPGRCTVPAHKH